MIKRVRVSQPRILMYHAIADPAHDPNKLCVSPARFEAQLLYLKQHNLRGVSVKELYHARSTGAAKSLIGLTFDDGYKDFLHAAVPILESFGFSATVFVVAGLLGKKNRWEHAHNPTPQMELLEATDLLEVSERGMEVGSHSLTHADLSGLNPRMLEEEVKGSHRVLSELLGEEVAGFGYPYGHLNHAAVESVRQAGYAYACGWRILLKHGGGAYNLRRIYISEKDNHLRIAAKLKAYSQYSAITRHFRPW